MLRLGVFAEVRRERIDGGKTLNTKSIYYSLLVYYKGTVLKAMHCFLLAPNPENTLYHATTTGSSPFESSECIIRQRLPLTIQCTCTFVDVDVVGAR